jgi:hypothetical protein
LVNINGEDCQYKGSDNSILTASKLGTGKKQDWKRLFSLAIAHSIDLISYHRKESKKIPTRNEDVVLSRTV